MTKQEAIEAMRDGKMVAHSLYDADEWMKETGSLYEFEDGCLCSHIQFWECRTGDVWNDGWAIVNKEK